MKLIIGIIIFSSIVIGFFFWFNSQNPPDMVQETEQEESVELVTSTGEIEPGIKLGSYHEIKTSDHKIEIGQENKKVLHPTVKFSKGNGDAPLSLSYPVSKDIEPKAEDNKITWQDKGKEIYFKKVAEGKNQYEFDITLHEKPGTNIFTYGIQADGLDFKAQKDGSYAVFKKLVTDDKSIYGKGELYRIEKPVITDAKGKKSDGNLTIDSSRLTVTVDPAFLASAAYPVTVDPTIDVQNTNHAVITKIDRFRWKMATEYEIRDDTGKLLGSDVVILEPHERENLHQVYSLLQDYLTRRTAAWLVAQDHQTLYEMSNDRLSSLHFQSFDNGDEVKDDHEASRQLRSRIISSVDNKNLPHFSLTSKEAQQLLNPSQASAQKGPILKQVKRPPRPQETPGAGVEILRPNGDTALIDTQDLGKNTTYYYQAVDDWPTEDDGVTLVDAWCWWDGNCGAYAVLDLDDTALNTQVITSLQLTGRGYCYTDLFDITPSWSVNIRRAGSEIAGPSSTSHPWTTVGPMSVTRPGGGGWIINDLNALQIDIGISARVIAGDVADSCGVTQAYVTVNYTDPIDRNVQGTLNLKGKLKIQ